jgi:hypothetical protein
LVSGRAQFFSPHPVSPGPVEFLIAFRLVDGAPLSVRVSPARSQTETPPTVGRCVGLNLGLVAALPIGRRRFGFAARTSGGALVTLGAF